MSLLQPLIPRMERTVLALDRFLSRALQSRRARGSLSLLHYCGWGTPGAAELSGRVVLPRTVKPPRNADPRWRNFVNILRRLLSREIGGVEVLGEFQGVQARAVSDSDGYFTLRFEAPRAAEAQAPAVVPAPPMPQALSQDIRPGADAQPVAEVVVPPGPTPAPLKTASPFVSGWQRAELRLGGRERVVQAQVRVVDDASCAYGLISDLDDTVIRSDVTSVARMLYTVLTGNARTRAPFPGVGSLYRALARHGSEPGRKRRNPVFYVSSSPWNFFDLLWQFLEYRRIPLGPLFLRSWGTEVQLGEGSHKHVVIERLLGVYPRLPFVLVGDSGERDPEIYAEVVRRHPGRVLAIYIRDVTGSGLDVRVERLRDEVARLGVDMVLARDSFAAAAHAMALGLITPGELRSVAQSVERAQAAPVLPF